MFSSANHFHENCQSFFEKTVNEGLAIHGDAEPDHVSVVCQNDTDYQKYCRFGVILGRNHICPQGTVNAFWLELHRKLTCEKFSVQWIEITMPRKDQQGTSEPTKLVFFKEDAQRSSKHKHPANDGWILQFQNKKAKAIVAAMN